MKLYCGCGENQSFESTITYKHNSGFHAEQNIDEQLSIRRQERQNLLQKIVNHVKTDSALSAAWLFGSDARRENDPLSDIDLWMVVDDEQLSDAIKRKHETIEAFGTPLFVLEVPGNAPIGGGYLMVQYMGTVGPIQVDWYWQARSLAKIPDDAKMLFNRVGLATAPGTKSVDACYLSQGIKPPVSDYRPSHSEQLHYRMTFFWCLLLIAAKKIARQDLGEANVLLGYTKNMLGQAHTLLEDDGSLSAQSKDGHADGSQAPASTLMDAYASLFAQHKEMQTLLLHLDAEELQFHNDALGSVERFLELAVDMVG